MISPKVQQSVLQGAPSFCMRAHVRHVKRGLRDPGRPLRCGVAVIFWSGRPRDVRIPPMPLDGRDADLSTAGCRWIYHHQQDSAL